MLGKGGPEAGVGHGAKMPTPRAWAREPPEADGPARYPKITMPPPLPKRRFTAELKMDPNEYDRLTLPK